MQPKASTPHSPISPLRDAAPRVEQRATSLDIFPSRVLVSRSNRTNLLPLSIYCTTCSLPSANASIRPHRKDERHILKIRTYLLPEHAQPLLQANALVGAVLHEHSLRPELEAGVAALADDVELWDNDGAAHLGGVVPGFFQDGVDALAEVVVEEGECGLAWRGKAS